MPDLKRLSATLLNEFANLKNDITRGGYVLEDFPLARQDLIRLKAGLTDEQLIEVLYHPTVASAWQQRVNAVTRCDVTVTEASKKAADKSAADFIREVVANIEFDKVTRKMLLAIMLGFQTAELMYAYDGKYIGLDKILVRDNRRFFFDGAKRLRLYTPQNGMGLILPDNKFWTFESGSLHDDNPYGLGLCSKLYWPVKFSKAIQEFLLTYLDRFASPTAIGKHSQGASEPERAELLKTVADFRTSSGIIIPENMAIELLETAKASEGEYTGALIYFDKLIVQLLLSQDATTSGTPGKLGNDTERGDVKESIIESDADELMESFNRQVINFLVKLNFPNAKPPKVFRLLEKSIDLKAQAERDAIICGLGFKLTPEYVKEVYGDGFMQEEKPEPTVPVAEPLPTNSALKKPPEDNPENTDDNLKESANSADFKENQLPDLDNLDEDLADNAIDKLSPFLDEQMTDIEKAVSTAANFEEALARLQQIVPNQTSVEYAELATQALIMANLSGRAKVIQDIEED